MSLFNSRRTSLLAAIGLLTLTITVSGVLIGRYARQQELLQVSASIDTLDQGFILTLVLLFSLLVLMSGLVLAAYVITAILNPIKKIAATAEAVGRGDLNQRVEFSGPDELGQLGRAFNLMVGQLKSYYGNLEQQVKEQTSKLHAVLKESETKNRQLEDTKRAVLNILEDLAEEKEQIDRERQRDEALLSSIGEGLIVIDQDGQISTVNPPACKMLGLESKELIGEWFPRIVPAYDEKGEKLLDTIDRPIMHSLSTGEAVTTRLHFERKDKTKFPVSVTISPVVIDGKPAGAIQVFRDITKELELEQAKEDFVALASHQLRTPATGVKAYASMLADGYAGPLKAKQKEFLSKVVDSNERQLRIIDDMLNVARIDSGKMTLDLKKFDLVAVIKDVLAEQSAILEGRNQTVRSTLPRELKLHADPTKILMVIDNLVSNASKYNQPGGNIEISLADKSKTVEVAVKDSGVGIAKKDMHKLFTRFGRIDNSLATKVGGTGLGLHLAKKIVDMHNGQIKVDSVPGKGTTFTVVLPKAVE